jgi:hypothetical protein
MTIFDLLFLFLALVSVVVWLSAAGLALAGRGKRAVGLLKRYGICFAAYMTVVAVVSLFNPRRVAGVGEPLCSDDWCLAVVSVDRTPEVYRVALRISSTAKRVTQREYGVSVYLLDSDQRRYDPRPSPADVPFDVPLGPQETVDTTRKFDVPASARPAGLVIRHDSGFPIGWFIIGYDTWFRQPTMVRLPG